MKGPLPIVVILFITIISGCIDQAAHPSLVIHTPEPQHRPAPSTDHQLSIQLDKDKISVSYQADTLSPASLFNLDSIISLHKADFKRITVAGPHNLSYSQFKGVMDLFKKHELYKFEMISDTTETYHHDNQ